MSELEVFARTVNSLLDDVAVPAASDGLLEVMKSESATRLVQAIQAGTVDLDDIVRRDLSREVSTHYKWCLYSSPQFSLWLNEYKDASVPGYARSVHNHRYSFASVIVSGHLRQRQYSMDHRDGVIKGIRVDADFISEENAAYSIDKDVVHQVVDWLKGTATLVLKGPVEKSSSEVFDLATFTVRDVDSMSSIRPLASRALRLTH